MLQQLSSECQKSRQSSKSEIIQMSLREAFPVCGAQNFLFAVRSQNFDRGTRLCPALSATGGAGQRGPGGKVAKIFDF